MPLTNPTVSAPNLAFGNGSDGAIVFDGSTDYSAFSSRSGSTYTLTRGVYATTVTINNGVTVKVVGSGPTNMPIVARYSITNGGTIDAKGTNASGSTGGTAGGTTTITGGSLQRGVAGGAGATTNAAGSVGNSPSSSLVAQRGGAGGAGGAGTNAGGAGGTVNADVASRGFVSGALIALQVALSNGNSPTSVSGGSGGGGGGCNGTNAAGGGGGEGGYPLFLAAPQIVNNGTITAVGGNGAAGATAGAGTGIAGGGGGGGGGCVFIYADIYAGTAPVVTGGSGGNGYNGGSAGSSGSAGNVVYLTNSN